MTGRFKFPLWLLPLAMAILVAVLGWWGNGRLRGIIEAQLQAQLKTTLDANVTALGIWTTNQMRIATSLAEEPSVRTLADQILQAPPPPTSPPPARREPRPSPPPQLEQFTADFRPRLAQLGYEVAQLVNTNFMMVANTLRPPWGGNIALSDAHTNKFAELFATGQPVVITPFKPELLMQRRAGRSPAGPGRTNDVRRANRPPPANGGRQRRGDVTLMQVAAPVRDDAKNVVGALALIINPDKEFSHILSVARSGGSGETYAFDQTGLLISHSRFDEQLKQLGLLDATNTSSALNLRLHDPGGDLTKGFRPSNSEMTNATLIRLVTGALDDDAVMVTEPVRDYRGVPIVGAACWLPQFGFGVATQMDASEAYRPLRVLQWIFGVLVLFLLLFATGLFVVSNLTWRRRLGEAELKLKQLGQYTLEEKIGEGGMGVVYRARHALMRRDTAVKLLLPDRADPAAIARFEQEVCLTCQLTHPNTIQVYDYGHTPDGIFYYAMEYLRGLNLHELIARYGPQTEGRVIYILTQICDSLAEAHALGLIHRDIKPGNIFLCRRGGVADCVKVLDFGLVQEYRADAPEAVAVTGANVIEGTPWFTPPEAIHGAAPVDPRSDLYALGALGYYLLTGRYIFDADSIAEVHQKQLNAVPIPPSQRLGRPVSAGLEQLLLQCLAKAPADRPASALALRERLAACGTADQWPVTARVAWWTAYELQPAASLAESGDASTPMATVRIDLASRME
jgi:hypothetical protein